MSHVVFAGDVVEGGYEQSLLGVRVGVVGVVEGQIGLRERSWISVLYVSVYVLFVVVMVCELRDCLSGLCGWNRSCEFDSCHCACANLIAIITLMQIPHRHYAPAKSYSHHHP